MNRFKYGIVLGCFSMMIFHLHSSLKAQVYSGLTALEISEYAEERYGPLVELISGEKYYYPYRKADGNPFLHGEEPQIATLQIHGRSYDKQRIKFDIYKQFVLLEFDDETGAAKSIIIRDQFLDQFVVNKTLFKKFEDKQGSKRFGQLIYEGDITCYYLWKKKYSVDTKVGEHEYSFSDPIRQSMLMINGQIRPYKGRRSFLRNFQGQSLVQIKAYMKQEAIRFRKISDREMGMLMELINQYYGNEN